MRLVSPAARRLVVALVAIVVVAGCRAPVRRPRRVPPPPVSYEATIADRVAQYGPAARARLVPFFRAAGVPYPPARFVLLGFKHERELQLLAAGPGRGLSYIRSYAIQGASGVLGPKLREGDRQVPEGVYSILYLNPNSVAHLSLALSYPNDYDRARAEEEGRDDLGGDIMIHGGSGVCRMPCSRRRGRRGAVRAGSGRRLERRGGPCEPGRLPPALLPPDYRAPTDWTNDLYVSLRAELMGMPLPSAASSRAAQRQRP